MKGGRMETKKPTYLQFPLYIMRDLITNKKQAIDKILDYGIYNGRKFIEYSIYDVAIHTMYCYYRGGGTKELDKLIKKLVANDEIEIDSETDGFTPKGEFAPDVEKLLACFEKDVHLCELAKENYLVSRSLKMLKIKGTVQYIIDSAKKIEVVKPSKDPLPMVNCSMLFDFRDNEKSEFQLIQFACYLGIRSTIGKKGFCKTNKQHILARAFGYSSIKEIPKNFTDSDEIKRGYLGNLFKKYSGRYHIDKVLKSLESTWGVFILSKNLRGMLIGIASKTTLDEMATHLVISNKKYKDKLLSDAKNQAIERAKEKLRATC
jgi:hypothetical protein